MINYITVPIMNETGLRLACLRELWLSEISVSGVCTVSTAIFRKTRRDPHSDIRDTIGLDQVP